MAVERRTLVLIGALVLALGTSAWMWFGPAPAPPAPSSAPPRSSRTSSQPLSRSATETPVAVRLASLASARNEPGDSRRNPFRFQPRFAAPPPTPPKPAEPPRPVNATPSGSDARPPAALPPIPLKFIGIVERENGTKWAVLTDGRGSLYGREGAVVEGRYQILKIGTESIEMAYVDGKGRQTIRLTGQ